MIDHNTVERIIDAAQIVDVVSEFVSLRKAGVNYKGLCPFHADKDPSLVVSPAKGLYKCFSCGHGGNAVRFIMEHEQLSYVEALRWLAKKYHIEIQERELSDEEKQLQSERESMFIVNEWAAKYFQDILQNDVDGRAVGMSYFRSRGFRDDIIRKFQLGYSPADRNALSREAHKKGFDEKFLISTGLCYKKENGQLNDRFYGRAMFPVHTISGKVVAFGGRVLDAATKGVDRKYVNSPESEIYNKSRELYGLFQAKQAIVRQNRCFLVEGYTDVISMHQSGIENVVSSSGTSLTTGQIRLLHRFTNQITLLYDGDAAGIKASLRGVDMLLKEGMNVKILLLPDGDDPDSFARKHTAQEFQQYIDEHQTDFIHFKTHLLLDESGNDPLKRADLIHTIVESIAVIPDEIIRSVYVKESARQLNVEERILLNEIVKIKKEEREKAENQNRRTEEGTPSDPHAETPGETTAENTTTATSSSGTSPYLTAPNPFYEKETLIIRQLVRFGERTIATGEDENGESVPISVVDYIALDMQQDGLRFHTELYNRILEDVLSHVHQIEGFKSEHYLLTHPDPDISQLAAELATDRYQISKLYTKGDQTGNREEDEIATRIPHLMNGLKLAIVENALKETQKSLMDPALQQNLEETRRLLTEYKKLTEAKRILAQRTGDRVILQT